MKTLYKTLSIMLPAVFWLWGCGAEAPPPPEPEVRSVTDEEAAADAARIRGEVAVTLADGLDVSLWASEKLLGDLVALHMDDHGRALVTVTNRSRGSEIDIRDAPPSWLQHTIELTSVEDRRAFLRRELAPERSDSNGWIEDYNEDGSHDWRDLAVMQEEVWWVEDLSGSGLANQARLFVRDFDDEVTDVAGAVTYHDGDVFLGVGPDMWRLRDTSGDDMADWKESISHGYNVHIGFSGHGRSGATVGPDGRIYWGIGDMGFDVVDRDGNRWSYPHTGAIVRSDPDGSNFEVFASGLRNTHEFVFDKHGNLITVDNDGDHAGESERLVYLIDGSDSGWRINWQFGKYTDTRNNDYHVWMDEGHFRPRFDEQAAHVLPPIAPFVAGPAGMAYHPGTAMDERWKDHFFVMSFRGSTANSPVHAFTLEPSGAGFELATDGEVLRGILAVGLDFGPDGALYLTDWFTGWLRKGEGRIWRLDSPGAADSQPRQETQRLLAEDFGARDPLTLIDLLAHEDMRVRQKAQFELAGRGETDVLLSAVEEAEDQLARIHGIWGLAQVGRRNAGAVDPLRRLLDDADPEIRAQSAKMLGDVRYSQAAAEVAALLADDEARVRLFAAEALGRMAHRPALDAVVVMLQENDDEDVWLRHAGAIALSRMGDPAAVVSLADHPSRAVRIAAVVALKRMEEPGVARFLEDEDEYVVTNAARAITDDAYLVDAFPALADMLAHERVRNEPLLRRALNANLYLGDTASADRLVSFALRPDVPEALRVEALQTLAVWTGSSRFDRVTGKFRGAVENDAALTHAFLGPLVDELSAAQSDAQGEAFTVAAIQALSGLQFADAVPAVRAVFDRQATGEVRMAALTGLGELGYGRMDEVIRLALSDEQQEVRMQALGLIEDLALPDEEAVALLASVLRTGDVPEQQTAYGILASASAGAASAVLGAEIDRLVAGEVAPEVELDLVLAIEAVASDRLMERLAEYRSARARDGPVAQYRETLNGGDAREGRRIFVQHVAAQCVRCHAVQGRGGDADAGPDLAGVASRLAREQILEALVDPSARLAPGWGSVTLTLDDGDVVGGVFEGETDTSITVSLGADERRTIEKSRIAERENAPSAMPPMGGILSRVELRDVVEYLTTLSGQP
jgi:quinoprotein glucose dehydrogenase